MLSKRFDKHFDRQENAFRMVKSKRVTIKEVAAEAGVSISTVSLVMNEKGYVSEKTRSRVLEAARRLGYVPTQAARQLVTQRAGNVGFVLREDHFTRSEPFYTRIFLGTEFEARHHNLYVLLTTIPRVYTPGQHTPRFLREQNVDGLLVAGKVDPAFLEEASAYGLPVVLVDFEVDGYPSVSIENRAGARAAVEHLIAQGHRRVAFVGADMAHPSLRARLDGYRDALGDAGLEIDPDLIITAADSEPTRRTGSLMSGRLFALQPRPTAVFCANDALAFGIIDAAGACDLTVPDDLAVVGFDDVDGAASATPPLTTVRVFKEQMGELALRYLTDLLGDATDNRRRYDRGTHQVKVAAELVVRASG